MCEFHESTCNGFGDIWWTDNPIYFSSIDDKSPFNDHFDQWQYMHVPIIYCNQDRHLRLALMSTIVNTRATAGRFKWCSSISSDSCTAECNLCGEVMWHFLKTGVTSLTYEVV